MNILKKIMATFLVALSATSLSACTPDETTAPDNAEMTPALAYAQTLGLGWNLGNNLDAHVDGVAVETGWGNGRATQKTFNAVKKAGFQSVRIPVTWLGHIGSAPAYRIEKAWLDRVAEVAGYAKKAGLRAIINIHHDGFGAETNPDAARRFWLNVPAAAKDPARNEAIKQQIMMVWMQIAERFKDEGDWLMFETFNELQDGKWGAGENLTDGGAQYRVINEWNQTALYAIRATGGENETRFIGVPGYVCQPGLTCDHLLLPDDVVEGRLLVAVHAYDPWDYAGSGKYNEWGHTGRDVVPGNGGEAEYVAMLDRLYTTYVSRGIPVYFGEFGTVHRAHESAEMFRKYYLEYILKAIHDRKMAAFWWDNGYNRVGDDAFGLINHSTGKYIANGKEIVDLMVGTWGNTDPAYTLESIYQHAPASAK